MKKIVFFDVDNVLVKGQTQKLLLKFLFKKEKIDFLFYIRIYLWFLLYKFNLVKDTINIRKKAFRVVSNWNVSEAENLFRIFFEQEIKPRIFNQSITAIQNYISQGYEVILSSASLFEIVDKLREFLSLRFAISTKLERTRGKYTGQIIGLIPYGENKVTEIKHLIENNNFSLEGSCAYCDHISDLQLLKMVDRPYAVNPDRKLRKVALMEGWKIYDFK